MRRWASHHKTTGPSTGESVLSGARGRGLEGAPAAAAAGLGRCCFRRDDTTSSTKEGRVGADEVRGARRRGRDVAGERLEEGLRVEVELGVAEPERLVDGRDAEAVHLDELARALVPAIVLAREVAPVAPRERDHGRPRKDFEDLPRERREGLVEDVVRLRPRDRRAVPQLLRRTVQQNVVIPDAVRFHAIIGFAAVRRNPKLRGVDAPVAREVELVRALHLPRLDEVLDHLLERAGGVVALLAREVRQVRQRVVGLRAEAPIRGRDVVHVRAPRLAELGVLDEQPRELRLDVVDRRLAHGTVRADRERALVVRLRGRRLGRRRRLGVAHRCVRASCGR
mmetsp:Transcript_16299/g.65851  ORF Transcript_16299/g.65851 Transcript_16299/m.65851 type:complete len:339 (-) Transcript_16299:97-1113(-)